MCFGGIRIFFCVLYTRVLPHVGTHTSMKLRTRMYVWLASLIRPFNTVAYLGMDTGRSHSMLLTYDEPYNDDDDNNDEGTIVKGA